MRTVKAMYLFSGMSCYLAFKASVMSSTNGQFSVIPVAVASQLYDAVALSAASPSAFPIVSAFCGSDRRMSMKAQMQ